MQTARTVGKRVTPDINIHRAYFEQWKEQLNIKKPEDWGKYTGVEVFSKLPKMKSIVYNHYRGSLIKALESIYPETEWSSFQWSRVTQRHWSKSENQRQFFDKVARQLNLKKKEDWHKVNLEQFLKFPQASSILGKYNFSLSAALEAVYPEVNWNPYERRRVKRQHWISLENRRKYMDWVGEQLGIERAEDWYDHPITEVQKIPRATSITAYYNDCMYKLLKSVYPEIDWNPWRFRSFPRHLTKDRGFLQQFFGDTMQSLPSNDFFQWNNIAYSRKQLKHKLLTNPFHQLYTPALPITPSHTLKHTITAHEATTHKHSNNIHDEEEEERNEILQPSDNNTKTAALHSCNTNFPFVKECG